MGKVQHSKRKSASRKKLRKLLVDLLGSSSESEYSSSNDAAELSDADSEMNHPIADLLPLPAAGPSSEPDNNDLLSLLGSKSAKVSIGPEVHPDVAVLLTEFLSQGLDKDLRKSTIARTPLLQNCSALPPPSLNTELHSCLDQSTLRQDNYLSKLQLQLATGLSVLALPFDEQFRATSSANSEDNKSKLDSLGTPLKLFADIFHALSLHRRHLILPALEPDVRKILEDCPLDACLFGQKFSDHLKTSKKTRTLGATLTKRAKPQIVVAPKVIPGTSRGSTPRTPLNYRRQLAHSRYKKEGGRKQPNSRPQQPRR